MSLRRYFANIEAREPGQEDSVVRIGPLWGVDADDVWQQLEEKGYLVLSVERGL